MLTKLQAINAKDRYIKAITDEGGEVQMDMALFDKAVAVVFADDPDKDSKAYKSALDKVRMQIDAMGRRPHNLAIQRLTKQAVKYRFTNPSFPSAMAESKRCAEELVQAHDGSVSNEDLGLEVYQVATPFDKKAKSKK